MCITVGFLTKDKYETAMFSLHAFIQQWESSNYERYHMVTNPNTLPICLFTENTCQFLIDMWVQTESLTHYKLLAQETFKNLMVLFKIFT